MPSSLRDILSTQSSKEEMLGFMRNHPETFDEALQLAISSEELYSWRAAWLINHCMKQNDDRVKDHLDVLVDSIPGKSDGHRRELMKILLKMEPGDEIEGR